MGRKRVKAGYEKLYTGLLCLYPKPFRSRFGEGMAQTFHDLCRERKQAGDGLFRFVLWTFVDTSVGIVRERIRSIRMPKTNIIRVAVATTFILLLPLLAMQFTDGVVWDLTDFVVAGGLLFGAGLTYELVARREDNTRCRVAWGLAVATGLLLIWMNLAVGLIGSEENTANLMYLGVLAVGFLGAIMARFRPRGMARALFATALAQALVPVIALTIWKPRIVSDEALTNVLFVNALFVMLFVGSALLFRRVDPDSTSPSRPSS